MDKIGAKLGEIRKNWGLSLRDVQDRSLQLAEDWGNPSCRISASWLARVERGGRDLSAAKLVVLAVIFSIPAEQLLALCLEPGDGGVAFDQVPNSKTPMFLKTDVVADRARSWLSEDILLRPIPHKTSLLPREDFLANQYRYGVIGFDENVLAPLVKPGSFVLIDTQRRAIASRKEWTNEFDRPIYFLLTHGGYCCGWCDLDKDAEWLTLVPHPLSYASATRLRYKKDVEVVGRITAILQRLEEHRADTPF